MKDSMNFFSIAAWIVSFYAIPFLISVLIDRLKKRDEKIPSASQPAPSSFQDQQSMSPREAYDLVYKFADLLADFENTKFFISHSGLLPDTTQRMITAIDIEVGRIKSIIMTINEKPNKSRKDYEMLQDLQWRKAHTGGLKVTIWQFFQDLHGEKLTIANELNSFAGSPELSEAAFRKLMDFSNTEFRDKLTNRASREIARREGV